MIKKGILFIGLFGIGQLCFTQETREFKWQDFLNSVKTTEVARPVRTGEFTVFQITDINKFLYKVEIAGRVFELQTPIPTELQTLFRLTPQQLEEKLADNKIKQASGIVDDKKKEMNQVRNDLVDKKAGESEEVKQLIQAMNTLIKTCEDYYTKTSKLSEQVFALKSVRNKLILIAQSDRSHSAIQTMLNEVILPNGESIKSDYHDMKELYIKVEMKYKEAERKASLAKEEAIKAGAGKNILDEIEKKLNDIKGAAEGVEEADDLISDETLLGLLDEVDFLYSELGNKNNFNVVSPPVQMDGDMISYFVDITPVMTRTLGPNKSPMHFKFDIPAKRGLKVDFGVGLAMSFGENSRDMKYYLKEDYAYPGSSSSQDSVSLKKLTNNNKVSPSLIAMMHMYSRGGKWVGWGGSFGIGAGFQGSQDVTFNFYTGLCLVLGKRDKVMLSSGISWLRIERIKEDQFKENDIYASVKIDLADVTEKVYRPSFFFGITYNLTNRVEIK